MTIRLARLGRLASGSVLCILAPLAVCAAQATNVSPGLSAVASVGARLAELELQRISLRASGDDSSTTKIDSQIRDVRGRLRQDDSTRKLVVARVLSALDARRATVSAGVAQARLVYTDAYPPVRRAIEETRLLDQRRSELRAGGF